MVYFYGFDFSWCNYGHVHFVRSVMAVTALANAKADMLRRVRGKDWVICKKYPIKGAATVIPTYCHNVAMPKPVLASFGDELCAIIAITKGGTVEAETPRIIMEAVRDKS
jgi:hypothetical protein